MEESSFRFRILSLLLLLLFWGLFSIYQLYNCTIRDREELLAKCASFAWKEAVLPGKRGAILDKDGVILASSRLKYSLLLASVPDTPGKRARLVRKLKKDFPDFQNYPPRRDLPLILKKDLSPEEIRKYSSKYHFWGEVVIRSRMERVCHYPALDLLIGRTALNDRGEMVGISGLEKELDNQLAARSGSCQVMLDRFGVWYPESLRILRAPRHGQDVKTSFVLQERLSMEKGESL